MQDVDSSSMKTGAEADGLKLRRERMEEWNE